ncbi:PEP-CTERM sorting domain-containing protein [Stieleria maiorica]|uniref:PEP-CTERM sorting domain-containing protein n=1 Tax=Stieleria maiorica TaxID=2795974 RepID=UPI00142F3995|nr:PEP-CTERM sorting domain-containing protein [Stieleria maiorica]
MPIRSRLTPLATVCILVLFAAPARGDVIAFWDFNNGYGVPDESIQIVHAATVGSGTLYQQRGDTDGNGKDGLAFSAPGLGIDTIDGQAMAWDDIAKSGDNDAEFFVEFSTVGFTDIQVRFDLRGNGDGADEIVSYDLKYDLNPLDDIAFSGGTIKDFAGGLSTSLLNNQPINANGSTFISETVDLAGVTAINHQPNVVIRFDDFRENGQMRIDNVLITGITAIPEPTSLGLLTLGGGLMVLRRGRKRVKLAE